MEESTIAAIATPPGRGGIGIVKISGKKSFSIARTIFQKAGNCSEKNKKYQSHRLYYGHIVDPESGKVIDEVLISFMPSPHSYTRESVIEINSHSGGVVLAAILKLALKQGAKLAEPGEFTKRAYLNGRIDLAQAEAVIDIINAKTEKSLEAAISHITGNFSENVGKIKKCLVDILVEIEAQIDFPDAVGDTAGYEKIRKLLNENVIGPLKNMIEKYESGHILRDGLKMAVVGMPNVGKSSLMNRLIQQDRAIVTKIPGTTRDLIEETLNIRGIPVIIADTAGLHKTYDPIEKIGIKKTKKYIKDADLILFIVDVSKKLSRDDLKIYNSVSKKKVIVVINKIDLDEEKKRFILPETWKNIPNVRTSALYGTGFEKLKDYIAKLFINDKNISNVDGIIPNLRQKTAIEKCLEFTVSATEGKGINFPIELIAMDIMEGIKQLEYITGEKTGEDVVDQIFSKFCIGK